MASIKEIINNEFINKDDNPLHIKLNNIYTNVNTLLKRNNDNIIMFSSNKNRYLSNLGGLSIKNPDIPNDFGYIFNYDANVKSNGFISDFIINSNLTTLYFNMNIRNDSGFEIPIQIKSSNNKLDTDYSIINNLILTNYKDNYNYAILRKTPQNIEKQIILNLNTDIILIQDVNTDDLVLTLVRPYILIFVNCNIKV